MVTQTREGSRRADARANHAALLKAATELAGQCSPDLPYDEIAQAAGVSRATVYRHFPTRAALAQAIIDASLERLEAVATEIEPGPGRLDAIFTVWARERLNVSRLVDLLIHTLPAEDLARAHRRLETILAHPVAEAQAGGVLPVPITPRDARIIFTMLAAALRAPQSPEDSRRATALARELLFGPALT